MSTSPCFDVEQMLALPLEHSNQNDFEEFNEVLKTYGTVTADDSTNTHLRLRNMASGALGLPQEYKIKYYSPYDQVNSIKEETRWSPNMTLDFPDMDTLDIILFEVFPMGEYFKSMSNDSTNSDDKLSREIKTDKMGDIKVFPNPNDGNFVILIENSNHVKAIYITDILGKRIDSRNVVTRENYYSNMSFKVGVYFIEVLFEDKVITQKFIIN